MIIKRPRDISCKKKMKKPALAHLVRFASHIFWTVLVVNCLTPPPRPLPRPENPDQAVADPVEVAKLKDHYGGLPADSESLYRDISPRCIIANAREGSYLSRKMYFTGDYSREVSRGTVCVWNARQELIHYGEYNEKGALAGIAVNFYNNRPRQVRIRKGDTELMRAWYWMENHRKWDFTFTELEIVYPAKAHRIYYQLSSNGLSVVKREETRNGIPNGVQFDATEVTKPNCIERNGAMERKIQRICPMNVPFIPLP